MTHVTAGRRGAMLTCLLGCAGGTEHAPVPATVRVPPAVVAGAAAPTAEAAMAEPVPFARNDAGEGDEPLPGELGWNVRTFREEAWESVWEKGQLHAELTWTLHQGEDRARLTVQVRANRPGEELSELHDLKLLDNVPYDIQWSWPSPVTTTFVGERVGPMSFRFVMQARGPDPFLASTLRLDCQTKGVPVRPQGAEPAVRSFYLSRHEPEEMGSGYDRVRWVPDSVVTVSASVCVRTWEVSPDQGPARRPPLVFAAATPKSPGVEQLRKLDALRWISPRATARADGTEPRLESPDPLSGVDASEGAPTDLAPGERTYRELVFDPRPRAEPIFHRVTWTLHGGQAQSLLVRREKPVPRGDKPFWSLRPEQEEYAWVPEAATRYVARRRQDGDFELTEQGSTSTPNALRLACRTKRLVVRPAGVDAVAHLLDVPVAFEPGHRPPTPACRWSWEPPEGEVVTAYVCARTWLGASPPGADASAPHAPPPAERALVFVAPTSAASGVEWTDRGDGVDGALRWMARGR